MEKSSLSCLDGLSDIGLRGGVDMRPTLIRVLTDLYVQKLTHTPDEERHYTELALRLLEAVDVSTRAAVAGRLARHLSPPSRVVQFLARDLPEVAAALRPQPAVQPPARPGRRCRVLRSCRSSQMPHPITRSLKQSTKPPLRADSAPNQPTSWVQKSPANSTNCSSEPTPTSDVSYCLISKLSFAGAPADPPRHAHAAVGQSLETAALGRNHEDLTRHLARSLHISREQAQRIVRDEYGEPIVVAAKALRIRPRCALSDPPVHQYSGRPLGRTRPRTC